MDTGVRFVEDAEQSIIAALDAVGIRTQEVCAERTAAGGLAVGLYVRQDAVSDNGRRSMEKVISRACGVRMRSVSPPVSAHGRGNLLRFEQATRFDVLTGIAMTAKGEVSGDSHSFQGLRDGRYMLMLCDGMGSGESAKKESAAAVSLIENFYQAGFHDSIIFDTINRLLLLKGSDDMFSTVDLCMLDLKKGGATFTKIGAECSYIIGDDGIATIAPGSLPIGIVDEMTPVNTRRSVRSGDMIIMMSDGITGVMGEDPEAWLMEIPRGTAQEMADAILFKALGGGAPGDDMTVMVSEIVSS
jgi:stage II sporulation protein E